MALAQATDTLNPSSDATVEQGLASVKLTPPLVLTIALMFIIASDGNIDEAESSQIQSVIGQNEALVQFASSYVRSVPIQDFLARAANGLSREDKLCILSNVCDAMWSDGLVRDIEQKTFDLLRQSFGFKKKEFAPHDHTLRLKNNKSVLGKFSPNASSVSMTPHIALAASILYMMSADGSIDKHEIGRLETLVAEYGGLQRMAVAYVRKTKRERFFQEAAYALNEVQKMFILLNLYDTMTADGVVAIAEDKIFQSVLDAFGVKLPEFANHADVLERKNLKPFDVRNVNVAHLYELTLANEKRESSQASEAPGQSMGEVVSRTIQNNVAQSKEVIGTDQNVIQIQANAMGALNVQQLDASNDPHHRERLSIEPANEPNVRRIDSDATGEHRESIDSGSHQDTRATLEADTSAANRQKVGSFEVRVENLTAEIEALHDQLIQFETKHKAWLSIGLAWRAEEENKAKLQAEAVADHRVVLPGEDTRPNFQTRIAGRFGLNRQTLDTGAPLLEAPLGSETSDALEKSESGVTSSLADQTGLEALSQHGGDNASPALGGQASRTGQASERASGGYSYVGRILPMAWNKSSAWPIKECLIAVSLAVCVSNLGAEKPHASREARGVLTQLHPTESGREP